MLNLTRLLPFVDFFVSRKTVESDRIVRSRIFVGLILTSIFLVICISFHHSIISTPTTKEYLGFVLTVCIQAGFLLFSRYSKDSELPCLLYFCFVGIHVALEAASGYKTLFHPNFHIIPLVLVFGFFTMVGKRKRQILVAFTFVTIGSAVVYLGQNGALTSVEQLTHDEQATIAITIFYRTLITLICMYWFVTLKKAAEKQIVQDIQLRVDTVKLGEISSSLENLIGDLQKPLQSVIGDVTAHIRAGTIPSETNLDNLSSQIKRMIEVTRSISWIYRAYRNEPVPITRASHFQTQLEILIHGKLPAKTWSLDFVRANDDPTLGGPLPTLILLILTLTEHIRHSYAQLDMLWMRVTMSFDSQTKELICDMLWPGSISANVRELDLQTDDELDLTEAKLRQELIAELMASCKAKMKIHQDENNFHVIVSGDWGVN